uniref:Uncharacterized protein n=1 Tax=Acrobeloides nanus TaxID=290746 RepID=A0A914DRE5_9BILA
MWINKRKHAKRFYALSTISFQGMDQCLRLIVVNPACIVPHAKTALLKEAITEVVHPVLLVNHVLLA